MSLRTCFSALLLALSLSPSADAATYTAERYDIEGATNVALWAINNRNQVVGEATFSGKSKSFYGTLGEAPIFFDGPPGSIATSISGISDEGVLVGSYATELREDYLGALVPAVNRGFIWDTINGFEIFEIAGAIATYAQAISGNGRYVVGSSISNDQWRAWFMDRSTGAIETTAAGAIAFGSGVNDLGEAVGTRFRVSDDYQTFGPEGFVYKDGATSYFQLSGQTRSSPSGIGNTGEMVGYIQSPDGGITAFIGDVNEYSLLPWQGWNTSAYAVNDAGIAVGLAFNNAGDRQALIFRVIPEPTSLGLILVGLAAAAVGRQKRLYR